MADLSDFQKVNLDTQAESEYHQFKGDADKLRAYLQKQKDHYEREVQNPLMYTELVEHMMQISKNATSEETKITVDPADGMAVKIDNDAQRFHMKYPDLAPYLRPKPQAGSGNAIGKDFEGNTKRRNEAIKDPDHFE